MGPNAQDNTGRNRMPRGSNTIPPAPTTHAAKTVLIPSGDRNWRMPNFNKKDRVPGTILGALLKHHYPQIVHDITERPPKNVAATKWRHWCMKGPQDNTCADRVRSDFLARYKWPDDEPECKDKFMKTLEACCTKLVTQEIYDLRIYAVMAYKVEIMHEITEFEDAKLIHLDAHEYRLVPFSWVNLDAWNELSIWWGSDDFKNKSAMKRAARLSRPESVNCGGSSSVTRTQQSLEVKYGRQFSLIEGFAVHMGASKQAVAEGDGNELPPLANGRAQEHLDNYRDGMKEAHGENVQWVKVPLDPQVMYQCTGRKPHGKFAIADGAIDSSEVQFSTNALPSQSQSSTRREMELEQEVQDVKRQRQQDHQSFYNAFAKFNDDMVQYMRQGCPNAPPPQIDLATLFDNPVPTPSGQSTMETNSVNATIQHMGRTPSGHVSQQSPSIYQQDGVDMGSPNAGRRQMNESSVGHLTGQALANPYQQDGLGNNSGTVDLQRMDGSTFRYIGQQNTYQQESMQHRSTNVLERMCATSIRNQGTSIANYHSRHTRVEDVTDDERGIFF